MTLFSYLVSRSENRNYREPEVLGELINRFPINFSKTQTQIAGWVAHYATGVGFEVLYSQLWKQKKIKPSLASGALLGAASGVAGILVWKAAFKAHPNPQPKNLKKYFGHLMLAHVVFGVFSALTYKSQKCIPQK
ncbi:MAG: hypothetical protein IT270_10410 [Saprospiraceae bacterium]|nr:hypothetical protein [Saprospiraceae bacterium]